MSTTRWFVQNSATYAGVFDRLNGRTAGVGVQRSGEDLPPGLQVQKGGVMLNRLAPADALSMRLFGDERFEKSRRVMKAVDEINAKYGRDAIRFCTARPGRRWETKFLRRSQRYTTCLGEVLRVA